MYKHQQANWLKSRPPWGRQGPEIHLPSIWPSKFQRCTAGTFPLSKFFFLHHSEHSEHDRPWKPEARLSSLPTGSFTRPSHSYCPSGSGHWSLSCSAMMSTCMIPGCREWRRGKAVRHSSRFSSSLQQWLIVFVTPCEGAGMWSAMDTAATLAVNTARTNPLATSNSGTQARSQTIVFDIRHFFRKELGHTGCISCECVFSLLVIRSCLIHWFGHGGHPEQGAQLRIHSAWSIRSA